jgi:hypothetical protein
LANRKCFYALEAEELKIAFLWFSPGTTGQETDRAKEMRATRSRILEPGPEDLTVILTLKRRKK